MRFAGAGPPAYVPEALKAGRAAGVILFKDNIASKPALTRLTAGCSARRAAGARRHRPGGRRDPQPHVGGARRRPGRRGDAGAGPRRRPRRGARPARRGRQRQPRAGRRRRQRPGDARPRLPGRRRAGRRGSPARRSRATAARASPPTAKHFPGLGAATANTDDAPVTLNRTPQQLLGDGPAAVPRRDRAPRPARDGLARRYPSLDPRRDRLAVAPVRSAACCGERLGFRGVIVTDSIEAKAVTERSGPAVAGVRSVRAGADLVLTTGPGSHLRVCARCSPRRGARRPSAAASRSPPRACSPSSASSDCARRASKATLRQWRSCWPRTASSASGAARPISSPSPSTSSGSGTR